MELYRAYDKFDAESDSLFLVDGDMMAVSHYTGPFDPWLERDSIQFEDWPSIELNWDRMIAPERIW